ncbi:hypothetical protein BC936DRAFT_143126 [Jimgerdemannia flammicorona]|uniref:Uncharacterized protein n=1 Tax=Jimgerdemannia flammicorona TaxID=994334 RepID=A0A433DEA4_9FUNG|nr:hypothetical protein BC936DRAFT_143126 [Jimgerdemannia flammicorona]
MGLVELVTDMANGFGTSLFLYRERMCVLGHIHEAISPTRHHLRNENSIRNETGAFRSRSIPMDWITVLNAASLARIFPERVIETASKRLSALYESQKVMTICGTFLDLRFGFPMVHGEMYNDEPLDSLFHRMRILRAVDEYASSEERMPAEQRLYRE